MGEVCIQLLFLEKDVKYSHTLSFRISIYTLDTFIGNLLFRKYIEKLHMCRDRHSTDMLENMGPFLLYAFLYIKLISKINIDQCV
jgi:hypothetical protein